MTKRLITIYNLYKIAPFFLKRIYSNNTINILRRDLTLPVQTIETTSPLNFRVLRADDVPKLLDTSLLNNDRESILDRFRLLHLFRSGIKTCYVAVGNDDLPRYVCWLIDSSENRKLKTVFHGGFPILKHDEVLFEGSFTIEKYRNQGLQNWGISQRILKSKEMGAKWAYAYVRQSNIYSFQAITKNGFAPFMMRRDHWRAFHRQFNYIMIDINAQSPTISEGSQERIVG